MSELMSGDEGFSSGLTKYKVVILGEQAVGKTAIVTRCSLPREAGGIW